MKETTCKFSIGQLIHHSRFDYRGVVVDIDPVFQGTEEWYEEIAKSRPPKDKPWYHVVVNNARHMTYVAERNLEADQFSDPIDNPYIEKFFSGFENDRYQSVVS